MASSTSTGVEISGSMNLFFAVGRVSTFEVGSVGTTFSCNLRLFSLAKVSRLLEVVVRVNIMSRTKLMATKI